MSVDENEIYRRYLLDILKSLIQFLDENCIEYYVLGGTLLGAVRHKGFIPWDDDIDIGIPRDSYEKLIENYKKLPEKIKFEYPGISFTSNSPSMRPFIRVYHADTIVKFETKSKYLRGLWVDIMPIDTTFNSSLLRTLHFYSIYFFKNLYITKVKSYDKAGLDSRSNLRKLLVFLSLFLSRNAIFNLMNKALTLVPLKSKYKGNLLGAWGKSEIVPAEWFGAGCKLDFEGIKVNAPIDYDNYLTSIYGDYMTPPDINNRKSDHNFKVIELN